MRRLLPIPLLLTAFLACGDGDAGGFPATGAGGVGGAGTAGNPSTGKGGSGNTSAKGGSPQGEAGTAGTSAEGGKGAKGGTGGKGGAGGKGGSGGKGGAGGKGGKGGTSSKGGAGGKSTCAEVTKTEGCIALCARWDSECGTACDPEKVCAVKKNHCAESMNSYLKCEADEGTFEPGADGCSIVHSCTLEPDLCTDDACINKGTGGKGGSTGKGGSSTGGIPSGWTCNPDYFDEVASGGEFALCDCDCGAPDPDCEVSAASTCASGEKCVAGVCTEKVVPPGWTCPKAKYDDNSTCDCNCGIADPDCVAGKKALGCKLGQTCDDKGACAGTAVVWTCASSRYADGVTCDCNCGATDPDCAKPKASVKGCLLNQTCEAGVCAGEGVPWKCSAGFYDEAAGGELSPFCDCGCGAPDPDCAVSGAKIFYCDADMKCSPAGVCTGGAKPVPAGWTCSAAKSRDATCDCDCGVYDPACDKPSTSTPLGCEKGQTCGKDAKCAGKPVVPPLDWTCSEFSYASGGSFPTCNCECGAADPDCALAGATVDGCKKGQTCGATGKCEGDEIKPPAAWTCSDYSYLSGGSSPTCNCACGARDPDCENPKSTVSGCGKGQTCDDAGKCAGTIIKAPPAWLAADCSEYSYASGGSFASCNCDCGGVVDPDCADPTADVVGCGKGQTCDAKGSCAGEIIKPPAAWTCPEYSYFSGGSCNCDCGARDPDCEDPEAFLIGCETGEKCSDLGKCVPKLVRVPRWEEGPILAGESAFFHWLPRVGRPACRS